MLKTKAILFLIFGLFTTITFATNENTPKLVYSDDEAIVAAGPYMEILEDPTNLLLLKDIFNHKGFQRQYDEIPQFGVSESTFWVKIKLINQTQKDQFVLRFNKVDVELLNLFYQDPNSNGFIQKNKNSMSKKYSGRIYLFEFNISEDQESVLYLQFKTKWNVNFPVEIGSRRTMMYKIFNRELLSGIYFGILLIMVLYNTFIYFSVKDKSYLYYVLYISTFLIFQFNELGYAYKYLWYMNPALYSVTAKLLPILTSIAAILFIRNFLKTSEFVPKLDLFYFVLIGLFVVSLVFVFDSSFNNIAFIVLHILTLASALYTLFIAIIILNKSFRPALFFLIAWSILLVSIAQFNLSSLGIIPYYGITDYSLEIGSSIEVVLLSLGLANRINVLKREKEISQLQALQLAKDKKDIIERQNLALEQQVYARTKKLELQNKTISDKNEEKLIMMREIHHRVKNNLQMINSMVRLQSRYVDDSASKEVLKKVQRRILTIAKLHERMYQSDNLKSIDIEAYIHSIVQDLFQIYTGEDHISYTIELDNVNLKIETIFPLGLLLSELVINALKHAFDELEQGIIKIKLKELDNEEFLLSVEDNGKGIDVEGFEQSESLGQRLISNFVKQLNGKLTISNGEGTTFSVHFTEPNKSSL